MKIDVARALEVECAVGPCLQCVSHTQTLLVPLIQLERREILLVAHVGEEVHMKFEIERVGGRVVPLEGASKDVAANARLIDQRRAQIAPEHDGLACGSPSPCHQNQKHAGGCDFGHARIVKRKVLETSRHWIFSMFRSQEPRSHLFRYRATASLRDWTCSFS